MNKKILKECFYSIIILMTLGLFSCDSDIKIDDLDDANIATSSKPVGYLVDKDGKRFRSTIEFRDQGLLSLHIAASKSITQNSEMNFEIKESILNDYNKLNDTDFKMLPIEAVSFVGGQTITMDAGTNKTAGKVLEITSLPSMEDGVSYVIPITATVTKGDLKMSGTKESEFMVFIKDLSHLPTVSDKNVDFTIISCMEVNDTNPLNNLSYTLASTGAPLVDIVIMFSGNINYNEQEEKVYIHHNPNNAHLLANRAKYLKPLQDRGIKVVYGLMGNHDRSGVANLSEQTAKVFAKEIKAVCDAYEIDGIFWDDEYSDYQYPVPPGFVYPSSQAASRLMYESKQAMPDRLNIAYVYGRTSPAYTIDGVLPGEYLDYALHDYGRGWDLSGNYLGLPKSGWGMHSQEFAQSRFASTANLAAIRNNGYANMIFAMDPFRSNATSQLNKMKEMATVMYDDELVVGETYPKDW